MLAFEPPHFGAGATLGGSVAAGLSGPRRASAYRRSMIVPVPSPPPQHMAINP